MDKYKFDESIKKALPFKRQKIDYNKLHKFIDISKIKKPKDIISAKALRRKINVEDDTLIYNLVVKPKML